MTLRPQTRPAAVTVLAAASLPSDHGLFELVTFAAGDDPVPHVALVRGDVTGEDVLVRVHSECATGDIFASRRCDCGEQLHRAMDLVDTADRGVIVYLRGHEGRGIGLVGKVRAYELQERGLDTVEANLALGYPVDARDFSPAAALLRHLGVRSVALLTNNPDKVRSLERAGVPCSSVIGLTSTVHAENERYLRTKTEQLGHAGLLPEPSRESA
jgi:3,4-dihydroxy 2-butanone 4-phosphate synthase/GTP cyclohydrolase II